MPREEIDAHCNAFLGCQCKDPAGNNWRCPNKDTTWDIWRLLLYLPHESKENLNDEWSVSARIIPYGALLATKTVSAGVRAITALLDLPRWFSSLSASCLRVVTRGTVEEY